MATDKGQVCLRIKGLSPGKAGKEARHDTTHRPDYADPVRSPDNTAWSWSPEGEMSINQRADIVRWGKWWRSHATPMSRRLAKKYYISVVLSLSTPPDDLVAGRAAALATLRDAAAKIGVRIVQIAEHLDEKTPHWQAIFTNLRDDGRTANRRVSRRDLSTLQDIAASYFSKIGYRRGDKGSTRVHYSVAEGHRREAAEAEAAREIAAACEARAARARAEALEMEHRARLAERKIRRDERYASGQRQRRRRITKHQEVMTR